MPVDTTNITWEAKRLPPTHHEMQGFAFSAESVEITVHGTILVTWECIEDESGLSPEDAQLHHEFHSTEEIENDLHPIPLDEYGHAALTSLKCTHHERGKAIFEIYGWDHIRG